MRRQCPALTRRCASACPPRSLFVLSLSNPLRMGAVLLVKSRYFDRFILMLIIVNCMFLTMDSKALGFESSSVGKVVALSRTSSPARMCSR